MSRSTYTPQFDITLNSALTRMAKEKVDKSLPSFPLGGNVNLGSFLSTLVGKRVQLASAGGEVSGKVVFVQKANKRITDTSYTEEWDSVHILQGKLDDLKSCKGQF